MTRMSMASSSESETVLVIRDNADDVTEDIAGLTSILDYDLKPGRSHRILDTYYDTKDGSLRKQRITLRVRKIDDARVLSMKSDPTFIIGKGTRRKELELPWSRSSIIRIARELGGKQYGNRTRFGTLPPSKALSSLGLIRAQTRLTRRLTRNIIAPGNERASRFAELDLDDVTYYLEGARIRLLEIEIEAKASKALSRIRRITDALESLYPEALREWVHGKFATGLAIQKLLKAGQLQGLLDRNLLVGDAFLAIDQTIRTTSF